MNLFNAWLFIMQSILNSTMSEVVEDYIELRNYSISFTSENCEELLTDKRIMNDYEEMRKVFFSQEENIFGHNYSKTLIGPKMGKETAIEDIIQLLRKSQMSRKAVLTFLPYGDEKVPCINVIHFLLRNNKLEISYFARGQDIYRKFPCDAMCIIEYGRLIAKKLDVEISYITATITSAHIYQKDIDVAKKTIQKGYGKKVILTGNVKKYAAYDDVLRRNNISLMVSDCEIPEIQAANSLTVVKSKAKAAFEMLGFPVWVDDVELRLKAYKDFPGAYTKSVFKQIGVDGLKALLNQKSHEATIVCRMCSFDGGSYRIFEGRNEGILDFEKDISDEKMPLNSIFIGEGTMIHRERALEKLIKL